MKTQICLLGLLLIGVCVGCGSEEGSSAGEANVNKSEAVVALVESTVDIYTGYANDAKELVAQDADDPGSYIKMPALNNTLVDKIKEDISPKVAALPEDEQKAYYLAVFDNDLGNKDEAMLAVETELRDMIGKAPGNQPGYSGYVIEALNYRAQIAEWKFDPLELYLSMK